MLYRPLSFGLLVAALSALPHQASSQPVPSLSDSVARLQAAADWWPPTFASDKDREEVFALWHEVEATLLRTAQDKATYGATVEILLGTIYRLGHNLDIPGASENARNHLLAAIALDPVDPEPHFILGRHLTFKGNFADGEFELLRAYALTPPDQLTDLHFLLAKNAYYAGQYALCVHFANRIPASHPAFEAIASWKSGASEALATGIPHKTIEIHDADPKGRTDVILKQ